jgi:hypothetical protein
LREVGLDDFPVERAVAGHTHFHLPQSRHLRLSNKLVCSQIPLPSVAFFKSKEVYIEDEFFHAVVGKERRQAVSRIDSQVCKGRELR